MCGITGWVSYDRDLRAERAGIDAMTATMACRGPDAAGTWVDTHVALGHRRLAVIDLEGGRQPMVAEDAGRPLAVLTHSGEIYNYRELRGELRGRGHTFTTASDTEVVLRGYQEWGEGVAERLVGMYAFAIWDAKRQALVLIRDRMGVKPLYYYPTSDGVLLGSEPKAILANPLAERAIDLDGLRELLVLIATPGHGIWKGMRTVRPGTAVTVAADGVRERTYWSLPTRPHPDGRDATIAHVRDLLDDIIAAQLISDVPRCTLLSGGLDSSAITALAARHLGATGEKVRSFTVDFAGHDDTYTADELRGSPDTPFAHDLAAHAGTQHQDITLDTRQLTDPAVRTEVVRARDIPFGAGDTDSSLYLLFRAVREHSTVALSGESADEVFAGYRWLHDPTIQQADTFPWLAAVPRQLIERTSLFDPALTKALDLTSYINDSYHTAAAAVDPLDGESDIDRRMRTSSYLHLTRLLRILLDRKDRMSMANGLEVRVPFCDHRLVEYLYNVPWSLKTFDGREKSLLRAATADLLPQSVIDRAKSHYPTTQDPAYLTGLQRQAAEILASPTHPVFELIDDDRLRALAVERDATDIGFTDRSDLELALDIAAWLDLYAPTVRAS